MPSVVVCVHVPRMQFVYVHPEGGAELSTPSGMRRKPSHALTCQHCSLQLEIASDCESCAANMLPPTCVNVLRVRSGATPAMHLDGGGCNDGNVVPTVASI